ncbi:hypothetical protein ACFSTC_03335 [Nonomuraea ferruginea]
MRLLSRSDQLDHGPLLPGARPQQPGQGGEERRAPFPRHDGEDFPVHGDDALQHDLVVGRAGLGAGALGRQPGRGDVGGDGRIDTLARRCACEFTADGRGPPGSAAAEFAHEAAVAGDGHDDAEVVERQRPAALGGLQAGHRLGVVTRHDGNGAAESADQQVLRQRHHDEPVGGVPSRGVP